VIQIDNPFEIIESMRDPKTISHAFDCEPYWNSISLSEGYPGILLLFSMMQLEDSSYEKVVHQYVLAIKEDLEAKGLNSLSMFSGATGVCFSLQCASNMGKRYQKMRETLHEFILQRVESNYFSPLNQLINSKRSSNSMLYDVIEGVSGLGGYALENLSDPRFENLSHQIIKILVSLCARISLRFFS